MHLGDFLLTVSKSLPLSGTGDSSTNGNVLYKRKTCILVVELFLHLLVLTGHQLQTSVCQRGTFWRSSLCPCHSELLELFRVCNEGHACSPSTLHWLDFSSSFFSVHFHEKQRIFLIFILFYVCVVSVKFIWITWKRMEKFWLHTADCIYQIAA